MHMWHSEMSFTQKLYVMHLYSQIHFLAKHSIATAFLFDSLSIWLSHCGIVFKNITYMSKFFTAC